MLPLRSEPRLVRHCLCGFPARESPDAGTGVGRLREYVAWVASASIRRGSAPLIYVREAF